MILVTAANRTIGRELVARLLAQGSAVRALVWNGGTDSELFDRADVVRAEPESSRPIDAAMVGVGQLFLHASGVLEPAELRSRIIESAVRAGVRQVVYLTRAGEDAGRVPSAGSLREIGVRVTELRSALTMQSLFALMPELVRKGELRAPLGAASVPLIDARDVADAAACCFSEPDSLAPYYDLNGPEPLTMADVAALFSARLGREVRYISANPEAAERAWLEAGVDAAVAAELARELRLAAVASGAEPSGDVEELLGREPCSLSELLSEITLQDAASA